MTTRKTLAHYGPKGALVRVFTEGDLVRVQWRGAGGQVKTRSWALNRANLIEAKEWAKGFSESRTLPVRERMTLRALYDAFAESEYSHLRERTKELYAEHWRYWQLMWASDFVAEDATLDMLIQFRTALEKRNLAVTTIGRAITTIKSVHQWGLAHEHLSRNRLHSYRYRVAKEKRAIPPAEYRAGDFGKLLEALDPKRPGGSWRAYCVLALCGYQGARQRAVLHLRWDDIDFEKRRVHWRPEWDKMGTDRWQPLREPAIATLRIAEAHRTGEWVFPAAKPNNREPVYSIQSVWCALRAAEVRAGIAHARNRAGHGLRRMLAGDIAAVTGNAMTGLHAIGDTDARQLPRYVQERQDEIAAAFGKLDGQGRIAPEPTASNGNAAVIEGMDAATDIQLRPATGGQRAQK